MAGELNIFGCEAGDLSEIASTSGTVAASTTQKRSGAYALRQNPAAGPSLANFGTFAANGTHVALSHTTLFIQGAIHIAALPIATTALYGLHTAINRGGTELLSIQYNSSTGFLQAGTASAFTNVFSGPEGGSLYNFEIRWVSGGTTQVRIFKGATGQDSGWVTVTGGTGTAAYFSSGHSSSTNATYDIYTDDLVIATSQPISGGKVTAAMVPNATGSAAQWTNGTGTTFAVVDEIPHNSDTDYLMETGTTGTHGLSMTTATSVGAKGTMQAFKVLATVRNVTAAAGSIAVSWVIGTRETATAWTNPGAIATYVTLQYVRSLDPGGGALTLANLDTLDVEVNNANANDARCTSMMAMVLWAIPVTLAGSQAAPSGRVRESAKLVRGNQPAATGTVAGEILGGAVEVTVTGSQAAPSGTIASLKTSFKSLAGAQAAPSGTVAFKRTLSHVTLAGAQPAGSGALAVRWLLRHITLTGSQPAATGAVVALELVFVSVGGSQPQPTGALSVQVLLAHIALAGEQAQPTGDVAAHQAFAQKSLAGAQDAPSGALVVQLVLVHLTLAGEQPGASGVVTALLIAAPAENVGFAPHVGTARFVGRISIGRGSVPRLGPGTGKVGP